jgi:acetolactate synthase I/II/III large subunit
MHRNSLPVRLYDRWSNAASDMRALADECQTASAIPGLSALSAPAATERRGADVLVGALEALGASAVFGVPGTHALAIWEGLRSSPIPTLAMRTELCSGFAADGYARASGRIAPLLLSTGPGALNSLTALMESASAHVPVLAISSQIPRELIGRNRGFLHDLPDQLASFAPVVKQARRAESASGLAELVAECWRVALTPPSGPVYMEVPVDVLDGPAGAAAVPDALDGLAEHPVPPDEALAEAAKLLAAAERPLLWAGGGVERSGAWAELRALAARLRAPVATTYMGKGAFPAGHPLAVGSACDDAAFADLLDDADVILCIGTELGAETTRQYQARLPGRLIQIDAAPERIGSTYEALAVVGDAAATLAALAPLVPARERDGEAERRAGAVRERIDAGLDAQDRELERGILRDIATAAGPEAVIAWDMTIMGYWAAAHFAVERPRTFLYPLGSGTLGYAWPAAIGAQAALPEARTLAVMGDGGVLYALQELASARQHELPAKLLIVDDRGYGILREYQRAAFGETHAVDLVQPDFEVVCRGFGVPARTVEPDALAGALGWAFGEPGPAAVILRTAVTAHEPTP